MEIRLAEIVDHTAHATTVKEHELLDRLTLPATEAQAAAYAALVDKRLSGLGEDRITGLQRMGVFPQCRFQPAVATCRAMRRRLDRAPVLPADVTSPGLT